MRIIDFSRDSPAFEFSIKTRTHFAIEKNSRRSIRATSSQRCSGASRTSVIRSPGVCRDASCSRTSANRKRFGLRYLARNVNSIFTDVSKPMRITLYARLSLEGSIILTRRKCSNLIFPRRLRRTRSSQDVGGPGSRSQRRVNYGNKRYRRYIVSRLQATRSISQEIRHDPTCSIPQRRRNRSEHPTLIENFGAFPRASANESGAKEKSVERAGNATSSGLVSVATPRARSVRGCRSRGEATLALRQVNRRGHVGRASNRSILSAIELRRKHRPRQHGVRTCTTRKNHGDQGRR